MVFEGELVIVLNEPYDREECLAFSKTVFEFPATTFVLCNVPPSSAKTVEEVNVIATTLGRSVLSVPHWSEVVEMFRPEKTFYFDNKVKRHIEAGKLSEPLKADKVVVIVFGSLPVKGINHIGLSHKLSLPAAVSIVLYLIEEALNPAGPLNL